MPFTHCVWLEWADSATPAQVNAAVEALLALKSEIDFVVSLSVGANSTHRAHHTHGLLVVLPSEAHLELYTKHPAHERVVKDFIAPIRKGAAAIDYEDASGSSAVAAGFTHMVWWDFGSASAEQLAAVERGVLAMKGEIACIASLSFGRNVTARTTHTHGLVVTLRRAEDLPVYEAHDAHQRFVRECVAPIRKAVNALDFADARAGSPRYTLVVGTRNYSSWSLRPWILMRRLRIPFDERDVSVMGVGVLNPNLSHVSPSGLVPCLHVPSARAAGGLAPVWESLAIAETLHERHPEAGVWPADAGARALARSVSAEMACGFHGVRSELSCNIRARTNGYPREKWPEMLAKNVQRIEELVVDARRTYGEPSGAGPFLFGAFCAADAMYTPVATRFRTYNVQLESPVARAYFASLLDNDEFREWEAAGARELAEGRVIAHYDAVTFEKGCGAAS
jgi:glutathione S-transferase